MKTVLIGLMALVSLSTFAGAASDDDRNPAIDLIRYKLKVGKQPTIEQLQIGKAWDCKKYLAGQKGYYEENVENFLKFEKHSSFIQNSGEAEPQRFVFKGTALIGGHSAAHLGKLYVRATKEGDLVVEEADEGRYGESFKIFDWDYKDVPVINKSFYARQYYFCPLKKVHE
jgi:hypothetical protein